MAEELKEHERQLGRPAVSLVLGILLLGAARDAASRDERIALDVNGIAFEFVHIAAGEFIMGSETARPDERPAHRVRIAQGFQMSRTEVTVAQFRAFINATGHQTQAQKDGGSHLCNAKGEWPFIPGASWQHPGCTQSDDHPAACVAWHDAVAFCQWLSLRTGDEIRLPTEAQWEYAARAGAVNADVNSLQEQAWYKPNSDGRPHPVAQRRPSEWGLHDMLGNVSEWCPDEYHKGYVQAPADGGAWLGDGDGYGYYPGENRIVRGATWITDDATKLRPAFRRALPPAMHDNLIGFRIVRIVRGSAPAERDANAARPSSGTAALVPVEVNLPRPVFRDTPQDIRAPRLKPLQKEPGPPFLAPVGAKNVALGKPISASDEEPVIGELAMVTDGDKEAADGSYVELAPLLQHVTIDLQGEYEIYGVRAWHYHKQPRVYFDVIVQISSDPDFITGVMTIFNNDMDNSAGLGVGTDMHYVDTSFGEIFDARGLRGRYVRLYSNGNTANDLNHYIEVEVYGRPVEDPSRLVPLKIELPRPLFVGVPSDCFRTPGLERPLGTPRPPILVPAGTTNIALGKPVSASTRELARGHPAMIVDGNKEAHDGSLVELGSGVQHVTIDPQGVCEIDAIVVWRNHRQPYVYFDVIVQVSEDPAFQTNVRTVFNNDSDASAHLRVGKDLHYIETHEGRLIETKGVRGRYVRLYSNGNTTNDLNHYIEVEVYGRPVE